MGLFGKISKGVSNAFKKVDSGANTFFKKADDGLKRVGGFASDAANQVGGVAKKAGNFLEKNSGIISDAAAGALYATGFGAPAATAVLAAGNSAQQFGGKLKRGGQSIQNSNMISQSQSRASDFVNTLNNSVSGVINQGNKTSQNMINQAQVKANNLGDSLNTALSSAGSGGGVQIV